MRLLPLAAALVAGCTSVSDYFPEGQVITMDGRAYVVTPHGSAPGVYGAGLDRPGTAETIGGAALTAPPRNVAAIEAATGCSVAPASVRNTATGWTWAAVVC